MKQELIDFADYLARNNQICSSINVDALVVDYLKSINFMLKQKAEAVSKNEANEEFCNCEAPELSNFPDGKIYCLKCWKEWYH